MGELRLIAAGDAMLVVELGSEIDPAINERVINLATALERARLAGVRDVVPTYRSIGVYFDPLVATFDGLSVEVRRLADASADTNAPDRAVIEVPVWYGGPFGRDLSDVAHFAHASEEEVVRLHVQPLYRVYMLGFMPGRAYLASVDPRIAMPRHKTPRLRVPSGSVGIAKFQTGFSAAEHPNGWRLIGRTPFKQFDLTRPEPFLFRPGDGVRFMPITEAEYHALESANSSS